MLDTSQNTTPFTIFELDNVNYPKHRGKLIDLYMISFTEGRFAQYIAPEVLESTIDDIMRIGFGFMAFQKDKLIGAVLCLSLKNDPDFPSDSHPDIDLEKTLYIADVMVDLDFRGQGVAQGLIQYLLDKSQLKPYEDAVIRVWNENVPALSLYKKIGFEEISTISQTKLHKETKAPFEMKKIYLHKKI
ncbi:MAG: GNAT family N-acetyltransferase [Candidatus Saccharimonadaceae bacterium]